MAAAEPLLIGLDLGTESARAGLFDSRGRVLGFASSPYPTQWRRPGWAEQDPADWWRAAGEAVRQVLANTGTSRDRVIALAYDTTSVTVVFLNENDQPVCPSVMWNDSRAALEGEELRAVACSLGGSDATMHLSAETIVAKALWVKRHWPDAWDRTRTVCEFLDYIALRLTGRRSMHLMCAMNAALYQADRQEYPAAFYAAAGLADLLERLPREMSPTGGLLGRLRPEAAEHLGLRPETLVVQGGIDASVAAVGLGLVKPGRTGVVAGSSNVISTLVPASELRPVPGLRPLNPSYLPGCATLSGAHHSGAILAWWRRVLAEAGLPADGFYDLVNREAARAPPGADGLVLAEWFQGNRSPWADPMVRGSLWGLSLSHGFPHLCRAMLEGIAYGTGTLIDCLRRGGIPVADFWICGGPTSSPLWMQIYADVTGARVHVPEVVQAACLGNAIFAALGAGIYRSLPEAAEQMVRERQVYEPQPEAHRTYQFYLDKYQRTYQAMHGLMREVSTQVLTSEEQI